MRQRNSNNAFNVSSPRSHPVNGVARSRSRNAAPPPPPPPDPVPVSLIQNTDFQRTSIPAPSSSSSTGTKQRSQHVPRPSVSSKQAFEEQYKKHFENQLQPSAAAVANNKRKDDSNSSVIEIPDDDHVPSSSKGPAKAPQTSGKVVKNANIGIHYPPNTQNKGTPIYLPDLPEGTSINKIQKKATGEASQQAKQNPATIMVVPNKQTPPQQRPSSSSSSSSSIRPPRRVEIYKETFKPTSTVQNIGNVTIIPTTRAPKTATSNIVRTRQPSQGSTQPRLIPPSGASSSSNTTTIVKKAVQQITQNSRGNTSITPVTRPSTSIPIADLNSQGWKRKTPPTENAPYPVKMIRVNPSLPTTRK